MNKMKRGAEQDDRYSDAWMLRIEDKWNVTAPSPIGARRGNARLAYLTSTSTTSTSTACTFDPSFLIVNVILEPSLRPFP